MDEVTQISQIIQINCLLMSVFFFEDSLEVKGILCKFVA